MAISGYWTVIQNGSPTEYKIPGLSTDVMEYRTGFNSGQSTSGCSSPTSVWQNGNWRENWACNAVVTVSFSFTGEDPPPPPPPPPAKKYDCINGACTESDVYDTPGLYQSLANCEVACGVGCSGVCISNADWAAITALASQNKNKHCS